jgi:hypothetical protein
MEGLKQRVEVEAANDPAYDREAKMKMAADSAKELLKEKIDESVVGEARFEPMQALMDELAESNDNRHVVEAIAQIRRLEEAALQQERLAAQYPLAA